MDSRLKEANETIDGLRVDLDQLIRVALTNPSDLQQFIKANYPRHYVIWEGQIPANDVARWDEIDIGELSIEAQRALGDLMIRLSKAGTTYMTVGEIKAFTVGFNASHPKDPK